MRYLEAMCFRVSPAALVLSLAISACDKPTTSTSTEDASPSAAPVVTMSSVPVEPPASVAVASAAPPAPTASATASTAPPRLPTTPHAKAPEPVATPAPAPAPAPPAPASTPKAASKRVTGNNFALDVASAGCRAATECAVTITLLPAGTFHVNKEYPYKFTASATPNLAFLGKGDATSFSRATGDFVEQGEKSATMTVRFKAAAAGDATVSGTYKLSVCSADQCQLEQQKIDLVINVM